MGLRQEGVGNLRNHRIEHRVHGPERGVLLHGNVGHREHPGGESPGRGTGPLDGIGIEPDAARLRNGILADEPFPDEPLPEELAHLHFQRTAAERQFAGDRRPVEPGVRGDPRHHGTGAADRRTDVVTAQDDHLLPGVPVVETGRPGHESGRLLRIMGGIDLGTAGRDQEHGGQQRYRNVSHDRNGYSFSGRVLMYTSRCGNGIWMPFSKKAL